MPITKELSDRIKRTARSLKQTQAGMADEATGERSKFLEDVLDHAISDLTQDEKTDFLTELQLLFPAEIQSAAAEPMGSGQAPAPEAHLPPTPERGTMDFAALEARFISEASMLPEAERKALSERLIEAGLVEEDDKEDTPSDGPIPHFTGAGMNPRAQAAMQAVMKKLQISRMDLTRTMKLLLLLIEASGQNDTLIWSTWRTISPKSNFRRAVDLKQEVVKYISGDPEISGMKVKQEHDKMQKLCACLIAGMGNAGAQFARSHLRKFSPEEIMTAATREGGLFANQEAKCWNQFVSISGELREENVDFAIRDAVAKYTETLLQR